MTPTMEEDVALGPVNVGIFGADAHVAPTGLDSNPVEKSWLFRRD
jgi:hypothetical protein